MIPKRGLFVSGLILLSPPVLPGCLGGPSPRQEAARAAGPRVRPDENEWRRSSVPLPPLYMDFDSSLGSHWTMVTPFYWRVTSAEERHEHLIPLAGHDRYRGGMESRGHVLNYLWAKRPDGGYRVVFPLSWSFDSERAETSLHGLLYTRTEKGGDHRRRTVLLPWLYSRETDDRGYDYWSVCCRLFGREKQVFANEERKRLWLFFVFKIGLS